MRRSHRRDAVRPALIAAAVVLTTAILIAVPAPDAQYSEPLRPRIHFTPPRNFMNDPNGLVYYKGEYHLFYQHNPFADTWGHMSWGHAVSTDMLHWQNLPVALHEEDGVMIFSGSAVVDRTNSSGLCRPVGNDRSCLVAIYTGHGHGKQTQNLAYSNDRGWTWTKYAGNPVIDLGLENFRDPKVFWYAPSNRWIMVTVLADQHKVRLFGSSDLKRWETLSDFGPAGATGGVWECPDLYPLPIDGSSDVGWMLDVDINPGGVAGGSGGQYFVGSFDGTRFTNDSAPDVTLWVDYGKDFYATTSFSDLPASDTRRIWMGWISNWLYANVEPTNGWRGGQSIPRALGLRRLPDGLRLTQRPIDELSSLRTGSAPVTLTDRAALPPSADVTFEVQRGEFQQAGLRLANGAGEHVDLGVAAGPELFVDRRESRVAEAPADYPGRHAGPVRWRDGRITVRVIFDRSVIEMFANDGETAITERVYPTQPFDRVEFLSGTPDADAHAQMWPLGSVWDSPQVRPH